MSFKKSYICQDCKKEFANQKNLDTHSTNGKCKGKIQINNSTNSKPNKKTKPTAFKPTIKQTIKPTEVIEIESSDDDLTQETMSLAGDKTTNVNKTDQEEKDELYERLLRVEQEKMELEEEKMQLEDDKQELEKENKELQDLIKKLKANIKKLESDANNNVKTVSTNTNNGTIINNTINMIGFNIEDIVDIDLVSLLVDIQKEYNSSPELTHSLHFDPITMEFRRLPTTNRVFENTFVVVKKKKGTGKTLKTIKMDGL